MLFYTVNIMTSNLLRWECIHFINCLHVKKNSHNGQHIHVLSVDLPRCLFNFPADQMNEHGSLINDDKYLI